MAKSRKVSIEEYKKQLEAIIRKHGFVVQHIGADYEKMLPPYSYTIGLADDGLPELCVFGIPGESAQVIVNELARRLKKEGSLPTDQPLNEVLEGFKCVLHALTHEQLAPYLLGAVTRQHPRPIHGIQIIWPDPSGTFPWEAGFDMRYAPAQPLLARQ